MTAPEVEILRALLLAQAQRLWSASLNGGPEAQARYEEMRCPAVGDFVAVLPVLRDVPLFRCIGILREVSLRSSLGGDPIDFVIERLDGTIQRWENASAMKLFTSAYPGHPSIVPPTSGTAYGREASS